MCSSLLQGSFLADTKFPVAFTAISIPGENVSFRNNALRIGRRHRTLVITLQLKERLTAVSFNFPILVRVNC